MGFAPALSIGLGAVGTISQMSAQSRQASAQRQQVEAQRLAAKQQYELSSQRFAYSKSNAEQQYIKELALQEQVRRQAQDSFTMATVQQGIANLQEQNQQQQFETGIDSQVAQLLGAAANTRGEASRANSQIYQALAQRISQNDAGAVAFVNRLANAGQTPDLANQVSRMSLLDSIANYQSGITSTGTNSRVSGRQASNFEESARLTNQYGTIVSDFLNAQRKINSEFQGFVQGRMPSILELQAQRNQTALEAAKYARSAELSMGQQTNVMNFGNQNRMFDAQMSSIQGPNVLGAIAGIGAQLAPMLMTGPQANPSGPSFGGPVFSPTTDFSQFNRPVAPYSTSRGISYPTLLDVPTTIPTYG